MGSWFKGLIGAACVVVIAGGGYYFYGEYQSAQRRADRIDLQMMREPCLARIQELEAGKLSGDDIPVLSKCANNGLISATEFQRAMDARSKRING